MEEDIRRLKEEYETVFNGTQDAVFLVAADPDGQFRYLRANTAYYQDTDITPAQLEGKRPREVWGEELGGRVEDYYRSCVESGAVLAYEETFPVPVDRPLWHSVLTPVWRDGRVEYLVGSSRNITGQRKMEEDLRLSRDRLSSILDGANLATWEWNISTGETVYNEHWAALLGYRLEELLPTTQDTWRRFVHPDDVEQADANLDLVFQKAATDYTAEYRMRHKDGTWRFIRDNGKVIQWTPDGKPARMSGVHIDLTEMRQRQEEIEYLSFRDQLTGLYNRRYFEEERKRLDVPRNLPLSFVMIDVNGLKLANDMLGHDAGDRILQRIADILQSECRQDDIIARIGGDEYVLLLPKTSGADSESLIARIRERLRRETADGMPLSAAIGWDTKSDPAEDSIAVLQRAEDRMYEYKKVESPGFRDRMLGMTLRMLQDRKRNDRLRMNRSEAAAIAFTFEALVSGQTYRPAMTPTEAEAELRHLAGILFDPALVEVFLGERTGR